MSACRVWSRAQAAVLTSAQFASPLAKVPYHLRAACISTWLASGVAVPRAAGWAGHSVQVLMRVYARCIDNDEAAALKRIGTTLKAPRRRGSRHGDDTAGSDDDDPLP
ncbi:hypothetical protein Pen01_04120 [Phytomonospora endophytica]|nr:hypothetical protein Pen01_04120 [Phytomonospora endophytica]